jgi:hypothetical protein
MLIGGGSVVTPTLTRAIHDIGEQAKKQLDETGSLAGFQAKFTDNSSGGGSVTISVSAMASAAFGDANAGKDDDFLAMYLTTAQPDGGGGTATGTSSAASLTVKDDQGVDAATQQFLDLAGMSNFGSFEVGQSDGSDTSADAAPVAAREASPIDLSQASAAFSKLKAKQDATSRLVDALQDLLKGLQNSSKQSLSSTANAQADDNKTESSLKNLLIRLDIQV